MGGPIDSRIWQDRAGLTVSAIVDRAADAGERWDDIEKIVRGAQNRSLATRPSSDLPTASGSTRSI